VKVSNKNWTGLNNVERMDKNGMTHTVNSMIFDAHNYVKYTRHHIAYLKSCNFATWSASCALILDSKSI